MILAFFNSTGYFITGDGVECARRCSPALTPEGDPIFQEIHHTYKVLSLLLGELQSVSTDADTMIFNDSRIIDELNGVTTPLDETCEQWVNSIKRDFVPAVKSIVFFRKKPTVFVNDKLREAYNSMLDVVSAEDRKNAQRIAEEAQQKQAKEVKRRAIKRLKDSWFGEQNGN